MRQGWGGVGYLGVHAITLPLCRYDVALVACRPALSRTQPVLTSCRLCTAGCHQPSAAPSGCDRLLNPQTTQPPPAPAPSTLPIGCSWPAPGPHQPQQGAPGPVTGGTHQRGLAAPPQAIPGRSQGERRGVWGEPCSLALGGSHHITRPQTGRGWGAPRTTGGDNALAVSDGGGLGCVCCGRSCELQ